MAKTFPWDATSDEIGRATKHLQSSLSITISTADVAAMVNTVFWLGIRRHEDRVLRPVLRWHTGFGDRTATELAEPVPLADVEAVRRLAAGWQAPKKLLVGSSSAGISIVGLALGPGIWAAPSPSLVVEAVDPGVVLMSSYTTSLVVLRPTGIEFFDSENSFARVLQNATDLHIDVCQTLHHLVGTARNAKCGGLFVLSPDPLSLKLGGYHPAVPWPVFQYFKSFPRLRERIVAGEIAPEDSGAIAQHFGAVRREVVEALGLLSGTDGAVVFDMGLTLFSFGSRLPAPTGSISYLEASVTRPEDPDVPTSSVAGTRHASAIEFVRANPSSVALVISHDGPVSIVTTVAEGQVWVLRDAELLIPMYEG